MARESDRHYICSEKTVLGAWSFDCRPCAGGCRSAGEERSRAIQTFLQGAVDLRMQMAEPLDLSVGKSLPSDIRRSREALCMEEFFRGRAVERLRVASRIYLMSFFEEVVKDGGATTLNRLVEDFKERCQGGLEGSCVKFYHSILFLEKIGVGHQSEMKLLNRIQGVDVSWSLGKALELRNRIIVEGAGS